MFLSKPKVSGIYYIYYQGSNGKRTRISTKTKYKSDALKFLTEFSKNLDESKNKRNQLSYISLKDFTKEYIRYSQSYHTFKTTLTYQTTFNALVNSLGDIPLNQITRKHLETFLQERVKVSIYAHRKDLINLKASFRWAVDNNYLKENPSQSIKRLKLPQKQPLFFNKEDFNKLISFVDNQDLKDLIKFAVNTGLRQAEIINLMFSQIDFENKTLILNNQHHITKSKAIRTIPLNNIAFDIIQKRFTDELNDFVFSMNGKKIVQDYLVRRFKYYVLESEVNPKLNFHSLRHSFASWLVQKGVSIYMVSKLLGHADIKTTEIYSHLRNEDFNSSVNMLN